MALIYPQKLAKLKNCKNCREMMFIKIAYFEINRRRTSTIFEAKADFTSVIKLVCYFQRNCCQPDGSERPNISQWGDLNPSIARHIMRLKRSSAE